MGEDSCLIEASISKAFRDDNWNLHLLNGPAIIYKSNEIEWWIHGREVTYEVVSWLRTNKISLPFSEEEQMLFDLTFAYGDNKPYDVFELLQHEIQKEIDRITDRIRY